MRVCSTLTAAFCVVQVSAFCAQQVRGSEMPSSLGSELSFANTSEMLDQRFSELPVWRGGGVQVDAPALPFNDASFSWAAGYI